MSVADETAVVEDEAVSTPDPPTSPSSVRIKGFVAGTASGLTKLAIGHPFDTIKLRVQCSPPGVYTGPLDCLLQTIKKEVGACTRWDLCQGVGLRGFRRIWKPVVIC